MITFVPAPTAEGNHPPLPDNIIMVQANIPQDEKWDSQYIERNFNRYVDKSLGVIQSSRPHIVIWPETAISYYLLDHDQFRVRFQNFLANLPPQSILITGILTYNDNHDHFNSIIVYDRDGQIIARYDKHPLVPFGEYMPFGLDTVTGFNNFKSGSPPKPLETPLGHFMPLICYESIFSHYAAAGPDNSILLNLTNDAWFGNTAGPYQHFDHMVFRAMETSSPALRLSGNGVSGLISPHGDILNVTQLNHIGFIKPKPLTK
jgi:apolipoprotein N-acyltransferase